MSWFWIGYALATPLHDSGSCLTMQQWSHWQPSVQSSMSEMKNNRLHHDMYNTPLERVFFSDSFAVHWGAAFDDSQRLSQIVSLLEMSLIEHIHQIGMPTLDQSQYFNVYLGGTGPDMPDSLDVAGYYDVDSSGQPMIVLGPFVIESWSIAATTIPHELFHALQHRTGQYGDFEDRWYWEATATWSEQVAIPSHPSHADFLHGYAFMPHLPLTYYSLFSSGAVDELHPYGAFILFQYLTENSVDNQAVGQSWTQQSHETPVLWWEDHLQTIGTDLATTVSEMSAHNVSWDYAEQVIYQANVDYQAREHPELDQRVVGTLSLDDAGLELSVPSNRRPGGMGYNHWQIDKGDRSPMVLHFDGVTVGDHFGHVDWKIAVVREDRYVPKYEYLSTTNGEAEVLITDMFPDEVITITVTAGSVDFHDDERFTYSWRVEPLIEEKVSACSQVPVWQPLWMLLVFGWVPISRRQGRRLDPTR